MTNPSGGGLVSDCFLSVLSGLRYVVHRLFYIVLDPIYHLALMTSHENNTAVIDDDIMTYDYVRHLRI